MRTTVTKRMRDLVEGDVVVYATNIVGDGCCGEQMDRNGKVSTFVSIQPNPRLPGRQVVKFKVSDGSTLSMNDDGSRLYDVKVVRP